MRRGDCLAIPATGPVPRRAGYRLHRRSGRTQTPHPSEAVLRFRHHRHIPCSAKRLDHDHPTEIGHFVSEELLPRIAPHMQMPSQSETAQQPAASPQAQ
ncbi:hypothetical protein GBJ32_04165 [Bifidobacterium longum]|uniref:Uncharacterized protein n=1 Tax=Bifidobacterium longum TaxID=216816 RepID=A0A6A2SLG7_BIFLN|nr:hypothetical protein GBJ29_04190 [Bifidobacterium longum]KAB7023132.1 hypothetical protein GBI57_01830 [Bifidobacterium longum]KAB7023634.1 hypothetical protein GBI72_02045 [Bifidobacterium longum]KAB7027782.1 hypothetical protein GBI75_04455 [Bifidobacterium longum]KAB7029191.1 hypothetical protein GBJ23_02085 [Bifidobacterium longum]